MTSKIPGIINLGSGKDFRDDSLNIDVDPYWNPDVVADIGTVFPKDGAQRVATRRFGEIEIRQGEFDVIVVNDVLEHVRDLVVAMTNCLNLLKPGGQLRIAVPYDLSYGAWQDPTHVRAFNERSWLYYTDWSWYLAWTSYRFDLKTLEFVPSDVGASLLKAGHAQEVVLRTPRAIDSMKVTLEKRALTAEEKDYVKQYLARRP
jgi:SAM-dependent methyltransferase